MGDDPSDAMDDNALRQLVSKIFVHLEDGKNVYLHCHAGQSRSGYLHMAMRMTALDETWEEAYMAILKDRPMSIGPLTGFKPNIGFLEHLKTWKPNTTSL
jgi:protein-tyrosine phosphatase